MMRFAVLFWSAFSSCAFAPEVLATDWRIPENSYGYASFEVLKGTWSPTIKRILRRNFVVPVRRIRIAAFSFRLCFLEILFFWEGRGEEE